MLLQEARRYDLEFPRSLGTSLFPFEKCAQESHPCQVVVVHL